MKYFATFDADGLPTGFYDDVVFTEATLPVNAIGITSQQWEAFVNNPGARRWENGHVVPYTPPTPVLTLEEQRKINFPNLEPDQFWFVVRASGYEPDLTAWVASMNDPDSPNYNPVNWAAASSKLEFAKFFERDHPFINQACEAIGMNEQELDYLWKFALT